MPHDFSPGDTAAGLPNARRLLLKLLVGDPAATLSAAGAVRACALFDIPATNARVALNRLQAAGLVQARARGCYGLGAAGLALGRQVSAWRTAGRQLRPWDGSWVMALCVEPLRRGSRAQRQRERALALLGFRHWKDGLHLRPDNFRSGAAGVRERLLALGLDAATPVFAAANLGAEHEAQVRALWDGAALGRAYAAGSERVGRSLAALPSLPLDDAARQSYLLGDAAIRQLVFDPLLPDPLVRSAERERFVDMVRRYEEAGRLIWQRFLG